VIDFQWSWPFLPTPGQIIEAGNVALVFAVILTGWGWMYERMVKASRAAAALLEREKLRAAAESAAELVAARLRAEAVLAAAEVLAAARLVQEKDHAEH
jgi:hypothetical protein